ncbi:hypothetical protein ABFX02_11G074300 [Erythranthe guttata]
MYRTNRIHKSEMQWLSNITFNGGSGAKIVVFRLGFAEMVIQIALAWWPCLLSSWMSNRDYSSLARRDFFYSYFMYIHIYVFVCILCNNTLDMIYIVLNISQK